MTMLHEAAVAADAAEKKAGVGIQVVGGSSVATEDATPLPVWLKPAGAMILLRMYVPPPFQRGVHLPKDYTDNQQFLAIDGEVMALGPDAYVSESQDNPFPSGPYCKIGDWVLVAKYAGGAIVFDIGDGAKYRLVKDTDVLGTLAGPETLRPKRGAPGVQAV